MRLIWGLLLLGTGAAGAVAADRLLIGPIEPTVGSPPISRTEPRPGDPPLVWVDGSLEDVGETQLLLRQGEGPTVTVERFAGHATRFFRPYGDEWRQLAEDEIAAIGTEDEACIEALVDGEAFLAIRVFLERICAPA